METVTAFLFNGPCDGETMQVVDRASRIEIAVMDTKDTHVYFIYSVNKICDIACRIYKFQETIPDDERRGH